MVFMASGIACGCVRTTTATSELPNMAAILQKKVDRDVQLWFTYNSLILDIHAMIN